ncbi:MAG: hypothetical protein IPH35_18400 [Rhodoferax sp.]|nr:hypothetical protein [Rhodoferax sp.]
MQKLARNGHFRLTLGKNGASTGLESQNFHSTILNDFESHLKFAESNLIANLQYFAIRRIAK